MGNIMLKDLFDKYEDVAIFERLAELYPDQANEYNAYMNALGELHNLEVISNEWSLEVYTGVSAYEDEVYYGVSGYSPDSPGQSYAMEYSDWGEWLGMNVMAESIAEFGELDVAAHILWEMTYTGFSYADVKQRSDELDELSNRINSGLDGCTTAEEVEKLFNSLNEIDIE